MPKNLNVSTLWRSCGGESRSPKVGGELQLALQSLAERGKMEMQTASRLAELRGNTSRQRHDGRSLEGLSLKKALVLWTKESLYLRRCVDAGTRREDHCSAKDKAATGRVVSQPTRMANTWRGRCRRAGRPSGFKDPSFSDALWFLGATTPLERNIHCLERTNTPTLVTEKVVPRPGFLGPPLRSSSREHWAAHLTPTSLRDVENAQGLMGRYSRLQSTN